MHQQSFQKEIPVFTAGSYLSMVARPVPARIARRMKGKKKKKKDIKENTMRANNFDIDICRFNSFNRACSLVGKRYQS